MIERYGSVYGVECDKCGWAEDVPTVCCDRCRKTLMTDHSDFFYANANQASSRKVS